MTAEHFTELVETVRMTRRVTQSEVADILQISRQALIKWKKWGVPSTKVRTSSERLRNFMKGDVE